ncbi:S-formylglutathione hydrolase [Acidithiobacillus thiooxidans]|jgi:S-formylglutathione hydrolase|uniref:S-formylglutathione hydrolase n=2 Tax=Acidithiobacillus thiooxidans TaxID=930 RepID=A0A1C2IXB4_ACITH|nr:MULTISPECIES: S-formylglutathione hydrolase [Acidithiobacillus]MDR7928551.1 S-formylglutathione hydrolase [Acidithiobacillus thiooxidans]OCX75172.1 S-formylglutathione hydrolase [Acidithiobacillus thiooxidans]OCX80675.1 S-formylglutathione hydrolase [Acidithiobacillus thiooxidans]QFX97746.1 S-formylglutathione hydrolase [Acidithiobacillus thiooxidans ATCC 19377]
MPAQELEILESHACFGGRMARYEHPSRHCQGPMRFAIFIPPHQPGEKLPVLTFLAGLTCSEETFMIKAGAQRYAAELGLILVAPDTSPRNTGIAGENDDWDFGSGAGFYLDATQAPWQAHYQMFSYVTEELPALIARNFPMSAGVQGICGHSMGGHGALVCGLRRPGQYQSLSAFAPVSAPSQTPWGQKAFSRYLGDDTRQWLAYDSLELLKSSGQQHPPILIDQGRADPFLEAELKTEYLETLNDPQIILRWHETYDHSYFFISSFIGEHLNFHARHLGAVPRSPAHD